MAAKKKIKKIVQTRVERRTWDVDDYYYVIPEIQVFESEFTQGAKVKITIELAE